jgi:hypothetical protein
MVEYRVGDFDEADEVRAVDVVHEVTFLAVLDALAVDGLHDALHSLVDLFTGPGEAQAVLRHLETGGGDAAGVGGRAVVMYRNSGRMRSLTFGL